MCVCVRNSVDEHPWGDTREAHLCCLLRTTVPEYAGRKSIGYLTHDMAIARGGGATYLSESTWKRGRLGEVVVRYTASTFVLRGCCRAWG